MNAPLYSIPGAASAAAAAAPSPEVDSGARTVNQVLAESQIETVMDELDRDLVGLTPVKARIRDISALLVIDKLRRNLGLEAQAPSLHMSFTGNLGVNHVLFKGGHGDSDVARDVLWSGGTFVPFEAPRQNTPHTHGTGCTLATAIACGLAQGRSLLDSVSRAHMFVQNAIRTASGLGHGHGPLNHKA